ncbi:MAG: hypothetical protein IKM05_07415 [Clostridia bacterium]|nr:hypothetical protein [Clostridia bacterium]MBR6753839.1 hypothetical protein [Clostridia bacterium]
MKRRAAIACMLAAAMLIGTCVMQTHNGTEEELPQREATRTTETEKLSGQAQIRQTMHFQRCGHQVERRVKVPDALAGADFKQVSAYYDQWLIQSMEKDSLVMERHIDLYCPAHVIVSMDHTGQVVLAENRYGDGMAILEILDTTPVEEEKRRMLLAGMGFDNREEAVAWLKMQGIIQ